MGLINKNKAAPQLFTWESFLKYYNGLVDNEIITFRKKNKCAYHGGKCTISSMVESDEFTKNTFLTVVSVLYYQEDPTKKIIERTIKSKFNYQEFSKDEPTLSVLRKLLKEKTEFNIAAPGKGGIR